MECGNKVLYFNRPAWVVGVRQPNHVIGEVGRFYDLARRPNTPRAEWCNVPEKHLRIYEETTPVSCNGAVQVIRHPTLVAGSDVCA